jgi:hypothetical protein
VSVLVPLTSGPAARSFNVNFKYQDLDDSGNALHPLATQTWACTVPANTAPSITPQGTQNVSRNASVSYTPTVTNAEGTDVLTYSWIQTAGTVMQMTSIPTVLTLVFSTSGADINGETITWQLTVSDGINTSVSQSFNFAVAARSFTPETRVINRSIRSGGISLRNSPSQAWGTLAATGLSTNLLREKHSALANGTPITNIISSSSVLIYSETGVIIRRLLTPTVAHLILDAVHTESDYTVVLTNQNQLLKFVAPAGLSTDFASATLNIPDFSALVPVSISSNNNYLNSRVFALPSPTGCLLIQVDNTTFKLQSKLELTTASGLLYGGNNVQWVRLSGVESLNKGTVFLGTKDGSGNYYETLVDLSHGTVTGTWDFSKIQKTNITTGEILVPESSYSGVTAVPVFNTPTLNSGTLSLTWTQERPDLVSSYEIYSSINDNPYQLLQRINSGLILSYNLTPVSLSTKYSFEIRAISSDGTSLFSAPVTIIIPAGLPPVPVLSVSLTGGIQIA